MSSGPGVVFDTIIRASERPMFSALGSLPQFVSTLEQNRAISAPCAAAYHEERLSLCSVASPEILDCESASGLL